MPKKILVFDLRNGEDKFFKDNKYEKFDIIYFRESLNEISLDKISQELKNTVEVISVFITSEINEKVIKAFKNLKLISTRSTGFNHINLVACEKNKIAVINVKSYGARAVAQYTFGLIIALERNFFTAVEDMKHRRVDLPKYVGRNLNNLTLGVIGTGEIGVGVCKMANLIGMNILAYDINPKIWLKQECNVNYTNIDNLTKNSDIITLHVPYKEENYHIFSSKEFKMMKNDAFLINTSRGELVDICALYEALIKHEIKGCALDVVECEKVSFESKNLFKNLSQCSKNCLTRAYIVQKMMDLTNVIITPHIAYSTYDALNEILNVTMENIEAFFQCKKINRLI